jgi:hypothetical protein
MRPGGQGLRGAMDLPEAWIFGVLMPVGSVARDHSPTDHFAGPMQLARSTVKERELSLVKIGHRSFVQAEELDDLPGRKRYDPSGRMEATGWPHLPRTVGR